MPIRVEQAQGQWLTLEDEDRSLMPGGARPEGWNAQLGMDLVVGERVWDVQSKFRIRLGPVGYAEFRRFFPGSDGLRRLGELTRSYVGTEFDFDVQTLLRPDAVPWCQLQSEGEDPARLGWNTWVRCNPLERPVEDAIFEVAE